MTATEGKTMMASSEIARQLHNHETPVAGRMRAIFGLKGLNTGSSVAALEHSLLTDRSALVRHEVAYVLGQMRAKGALETLHRVVEDVDEDVMVRHEAAEAMGAIGDPISIPILTRFAEDADTAREVRETCVLALRRIGWEGEGGEHVGCGRYSSVDPAPATKVEMTVEGLRETLCDTGREMFERYRAMFGLRNRGGAEAVRALCDGMEGEMGSALFRHEVAYVLGQMGDAGAVGTLVRFLRDEKEHEMVRHEAAEALGAIGTVEAERELEKYVGDDVDVIRESVEVALDISEYVSSGEFQYAETKVVSGEQ